MALETPGTGIGVSAIKVVMVSPDTQMAPARSHSSEVLNYRIKGSHSLLFRFNFFGYVIDLVLNKLLLSHCCSRWRGLG